MSNLGGCLEATHVCGRWGAVGSPHTEEAIRNGHQSQKVIQQPYKRHPCRDSNPQLPLSSLLYAVAGLKRHLTIMDRERVKRFEGKVKGKAVPAL
jgi:hypothetical protein